MSSSSACAFLFSPGRPIRTEKMVFWGKPHPKERPRKARTGHLYDPASNREAEGKLQEEIARLYPGVPRKFTGPLQVECFFMYPKPKNWFPGKPKGKPDIDNLLKTVCDAFNGILWEDDSQIVGKKGEKEFWDEAEPATIIRITYYHPA